MIDVSTCALGITGDFVVVSHRVSGGIDSNP